MVVCRFIPGGSSRVGCSAAGLENHCLPPLLRSKGWAASCCQNQTRNQLQGGKEIPPVLTEEAGAA